MHLMLIFSKKSPKIEKHSYFCRQITSMQRHQRFITNTAALVCLAFIFRLAFVNVAMITSLNGPQTFKSSRTFTSNHYKKKAGGTDAMVRADLNTYPDLQVCDADLGSEKDPTKDKIPSVLSLFHSFFNPQTTVIRSTTPFDLIKCSLYPKKYLSLSILRV